MIDARAVRIGLFACVLAMSQAGGAEAAGRPVAFTAADGTMIAGSFFEPRSRPAVAVLLVHMLGRSKDDWAETAERLSDAGLHALAIDLRGHGQSGGSASSLDAMAADVRAGLEWLRGRVGVRPDRIAVVGASLGANLALTVASALPWVRAMALLSPSLDYRGVRIDAAMLAKYGARPAWLAASTADPYAWRTVRELTEGTEGREVRTTTAPAHGTKLLATDPFLARELVDWLQRTLIF